MLRYTVTYVREPEPGLDVEIVRTGARAPEAFLFTQTGPVSQVRLVDAKGRSSGTLSVSEEGDVVVPGGSHALRYHYPLGSRPRRRQSSLFTGMGEGDAWHVAGRAWLLRPRSVWPPVRAELVVKGTDALLPWAPDARGVYHLMGEDLVDSGFMGLGGRRCTLKVPGAEVEVAVLGRTAHVGDAALCAWVRQAALEVLTVRRSFPYPRVTVRIVTVPGRADSGLFGMLLWSSPPSISLLVGQDAAPEGFQEDWVAVHELLHMLHPTFIPSVPWLSEGLATYYTEVARARSGRRTPEQAWTELVAGFARGRDAVGSRSMEDVVTRQDSYQGTYWTGALFALHLDVELRRATRQEKGLETVLERLTASGDTSTLDDFGLTVDRVAGKSLFRALLAQHWRQPAFAQQAALLRALGVGVGPKGRVKLEEAPDSALRELLTRRRPAPVRE